MRRLGQIFTYCISGGVPQRSLAVSLIVGTILNLINQGDVVMAGGQVNLAKLFLTYVVPYCVATYGAVSFRCAVASADAPQ